MQNNSSLPILVAEDSHEDFDILQLTFSRFKIHNPILRCETGEAVIQTLKKIQEHNDTLPGIIILDLNLIGMDGREVLRLLKSSQAFKQIPVLVLSTSSSPKDVEACYSAGANSYSLKPVDLERFESFVQMVKTYWLEHTILPRQSKYDLTRKLNV